MGPAALCPSSDYSIAHFADLSRGFSKLFEKSFAGRDPAEAALAPWMPGPGVVVPGRKLAEGSRKKGLTGAGVYAIMRS